MQRGTVLVLEDDATIIELLQVMLEQMGFDVLPFMRADKALQGVEGVDLALAVVDVRLPGMSGLQFIEELKKIPEFEDTPTLIVSARDEDDDILEGYKQGASYYLPKPFSSKQLEYAVNFCLEGKVKKSNGS